MFLPLLFNTRLLKSGDSVNRYMKLIGIELAMLLGVFFNSFVLDIFSHKVYYNVFWLIILILTVIFFGFEKDKSLKRVDTMQSIFIISISYLIATYIFGFFFGYVRSIYNLSLSSIISNITPVIITILLQELTRYNIVAKTKKAKFDYIIVGIMIMLFIICDIIYSVKSLETVRNIGIFETIGLYILPSIAKNLLLTFMVYHVGYKPAIMYRLIFDITAYILPIFPDFGTYLQSVLNIAFPTVMFLILNRKFKKGTGVFVRENKTARIVSWVVSITILGLLVMLVSGIFKYYALTIGSGSMQPNINIGDVVIVKKLDKNELPSLRKGDVLVFEHEKTIVHRIVEIYEDNGSYSYQTKGDNNNDIDGFIVYEDQVIGIAKYKIPIIGRPTVWLSEHFKD